MFHKSILSVTWYVVDVLFSSVVLRCKKAIYIPVSILQYPVISSMSDVHVFLFII